MINIAVVEDLPIIREGIKVLIDQVADFNVIAEYENGQEFVDDLLNITPDIVLTDIDMPVLDGIEATKAALNQKPKLKIIALSMYNEYKFYYEMIKAGAKGFVLKQASVDELESAIYAVHGGENYFSKELLHNVIMSMQNIEKEIQQEINTAQQLNEKEHKLIRLICKGLSNKELAETLFLSVKTIESQKKKLMQKTNAKNTAGLIIWAIKNKVVEL